MSDYICQLRQAIDRYVFNVSVLRLASIVARQYGARPNRESSSRIGAIVRH
jgi:hypothetical protein